MVDWDRVEELRSKGWDWDRIARDPKVGFHPEASVREPGHALRALYHRQKSRERRQGPPPEKKVSKRAAEELERKWTLKRIGYLLVPVAGIWCALAYVAPSPIGLVLPAVPYLALILAVAAFVLVFALWRSTGARWTKVYRSTVISGVVLGLVVAGMIGIVGALVFGCPYLPPTSTATSQSSGWTSYSVSPWHENGLPVVYFYGASWCPYCSASSWAIWKALTEFGSLSGAYTDYSSSSDVDPGTPEMVLTSVQFSSTTVAFQVSEDTSGVDGTFPGTSSCYQQAYVTAYSGGSIPFVVVNGQYVHGGSSLIDPAALSNWAAGGATAVENAVASESTAAMSPWLVVQSQAWWVMAFMAKSTGDSVSALASQYHWSSATQSAVASDLNLIS
jgi:hypothetical protein